LLRPPSYAAPPLAVAIDSVLSPEPEAPSWPPVEAKQPAEIAAAPLAESEKRPFLVLPAPDGPIAPRAEPAPDAPPVAENEAALRMVIDDLSPGSQPETEVQPQPETAGAARLSMNEPVLSPAERPVMQRVWDWLRAYRETFNLVRLQKSLNSQYARGGFRARIFDAAYYRSQGPIPARQDELEHYLLIGEAQGRRPLYCFDPVFYRREIADAEVHGSLLRHFIETGVDEGRSPSAELEPIARRAMAAGQSRLEFFLRCEEKTRESRASAR
jgi:hypothetical protein